MQSSHRLRVLFVIPDMSGGGSERVLLTLLRTLDRSRFEPLLLMMRDDGAFMNELPSDIERHFLGVARSRFAAFQLVRRIRQLKPEVIVSMALHLTVLLAILRPFMPRNTRVCAYQNIHPSAFAGDNRFRLWRTLMRLFLPKMNRIICQTDEMVDDLAKNFGIDRRIMIRIYNPVDRNAIRNAASGPSPYSGPGPHLVCAGRLDPQKGFDVLLQAISILKARSIVVEVTILGLGDQESMLRGLAQELGIASLIHFVGFQANPYVYFKNADAFVLSSRYEGLSNAMLEAASLATPMVAVDVPGGIREALCGSNACWIAPKHDSKSLADAIAQCIQDLPRVKTIGVRHPLIEEMESARITRRYEEVISACLSD